MKRLSVFAAVLTVSIVIAGAAIGISLVSFPTGFHHSGKLEVHITDFSVSFNNHSRPDYANLSTFVNNSNLTYVNTTVGYHPMYLELVTFNNSGNESYNVTGISSVLPTFNVSVIYQPVKEHDGGNLSPGQYSGLPLKILPHSYALASIILTYTGNSSYTGPLSVNLVIPQNPAME